MEMVLVLMQISFATAMRIVRTKGMNKGAVSRFLKIPFS